MKWVIYHRGDLVRVGPDGWWGGKPLLGLARPDGRYIRIDPFSQYRGQGSIYHHSEGLYLAPDSERLSLIKHLTNAPWLALKNKKRWITQNSI